MKIRKAAKSDLDEIMKIYEGARLFMKSHGNPTQWGDSHPPRAMIENDIEAGKSYVLADDGGALLAAFYFAVEGDPTYRVIENGEWLNREPYGVVHRLASSMTVRGSATFCLDWAFGECGNLRVDTHDDNIPMQTLLKKLGFTPCGTIYCDDGTPRIAFHKSAL